MKLLIKEKIGARCIIEEDGQKIYNHIHEPLKKGEHIVLDFEGVTQFAAPFFNFAIGQLLKDIKENELTSLLKIKNINEAGALVLCRVKENAKIYHADTNYRKIVNHILEEQIKASE